VATNLRIALLVFLVGFAVETAGSLYVWITHAAGLPFGGALLYLPLIFTVVGLVFLSVGRHEWNELHARRVVHARRLFALALVIGGVAAVIVAYYVEVAPTAAQPAALAPFVAFAAAAAYFTSYLLYAMVAAHLLRPVALLLLAGALVWAAYVAFELARTIDGQFGSYLLILRTHTASVSGLTAPLTAELSTMFVTYALLAVAFADAHRRVALGPDPSPAPH
jgi:hypothetical protein